MAGKNQGKIQIQLCPSANDEIEKVRGLFSSPLA